MYVGIFDDYQVRNIVLKGKRAILIRILEPASNSLDYPRIINESSYQAILELGIPDLVKPINNHELKEEFDKLNQFILKVDFDEVIIHCRMGLSRSPAIMICIAKILNNVELELFLKEKFKFYNKFIVQEFEALGYFSKKVEDTQFRYECFSLKNDDKEEKIVVEEVTTTELRIKKLKKVLN